MTRPRPASRGLLLTETGRTAYLSCAVAALAADIDLSTGVAVAFPRSPMVTASIAWELAEASRGRFRLGLGTQVRAHIERRYSSPFDPPGPRLREYLIALRKIFAAFRGESRLDHQGDYYSFSLLPDQWSPGPIDYPDPPLDIAAVNPWMLRMAGEVADGVHVHPLNSLSYLRHTVVTEVAAGAAKAGRDPAEVALIVPCVTAVGDSAEEIATPTGDRSGPDRLLRIDAQLRVPVRTSGIPGHDPPGARETEGRGPAAA